MNVCIQALANIEGLHQDLLKQKSLMDEERIRRRQRAAQGKRGSHQRSITAPMHSRHRSRGRLQERHSLGATSITDALLSCLQDIDERQVLKRKWQDHEWMRIE